MPFKNRIKYNLKKINIKTKKTELDSYKDCNFSNPKTTYISRLIFLLFFSYF